MSAPKPAKRKRTPILLVDDHALVRQAVRASIEREKDLVICGEADDRMSALQAIVASSPKLVIVDVGLGNSDGLDLIREIRTRHPEVLTLGLSMYDESIYAQRAIEAGARGYITKQEAVTKVIPAVRHVLAGELYLSQKVAAQITSRLAHSPADAHAQTPQRLSPQELEILQLLGVVAKTPQDAPIEHPEPTPPHPQDHTPAGGAPCDDTTHILQAAIRAAANPKPSKTGHSAPARKRD